MRLLQKKTHQKDFLQQSHQNCQTKKKSKLKMSSSQKTHRSLFLRVATLRYYKWEVTRIESQAPTKGTNFLHSLFKNPWGKKIKAVLWVPVFSFRCGKKLGKHSKQLGSDETDEYEWSQFGSSDVFC